MYEFLVVGLLLYIAYQIAKSNGDDWFNNFPY
jgi:hypothetical protein